MIDIALAFNPKTMKDQSGLQRNTRDNLDNLTGTQREYKFNRGLTIVIYIFGPLMIAFLLLFLISPLTGFGGKHIPIQAYWTLAPFFLSMIGLMSAAILDAYKAKFIIRQDRIISISAFTNCELFLGEIKGYRLSDKFIFINPNVEGKKRIKISKKFGKVKEIETWLADNYDDLDILNEQEERQAILNNEEYGVTEEQRASNLKRARIVARTLNIAAFLCIFLFFIFPSRYTLFAVAAMPVLAIISMKYFKGLVRINLKKGTAYPSVVWVFFACSLGLAIKGFASYHIFDFAHAWKPVILVTFLLSFFSLAKNRQLKKLEDYFNLAWLLVLGFSYAFGSVINTNCLFDNSTPEIYQSTILNKRLTRGKSTTYYLELGPWGPQKEADEIVVTKKLYEALFITETVHVSFKKGRWDIPWFMVSE